MSIEFNGPTKENFIKMINGQDHIHVINGIYIPRPILRRATLIYGTNNYTIRVERHAQRKLRFFLNNEQTDLETLSDTICDKNERLIRMNLWNRLLSEQELELTKTMYK